MFTTVIFSAVSYALFSVFGDIGTAAIVAAPATLLVKVSKDLFL